jgi:enoyl-CoA hydratase
MSTEQSPTGDVETHERGGVIEVILTRPQKLNAMTPEMTGAISAAVDELGRRPDLRVMLIRAKGRYFSAGSDFIGTGQGIPDFGGSTMAARHWYRGSVDRVSLSSICDKIEAVEKPVVVAHHATCLGGALEMSLSCDFRLAAKSARYGLPEIDLGHMPGSGGASRMVRICGPHWARWIVMAGKQVDADRALMMGMVHEVYADDVFEAEVEAFCQHLMTLSAEALGLAKLSIDMIADLDRASGRTMERLANSVLFQGADTHQKMNAFKAKRAAAQAEREKK